MNGQGIRFKTAMTTSGTDKKNKKNKIPQRGLGVAQLEKMRMEEQQKSAAAASAPPPPPLSTIVPPQGMCPTTRPRVDPSPASSSAAATVLSLKRSASVPLTVDFIGGPPHQRALEGSVAAAARSSSSGFLPVLCNESTTGPHQAEAMIKKDPMSFNLRLLEMANKAKSPFSSGHNLQIEPPSNQNYTGNYDLLSCWRQQEKMAGMKRQYPFQQDSKSASYPCKVPALTSSYHNFEESLPSYGNCAALSETQSKVFGGRNSGSSFRNTSYEVKVDREGKQNCVTVDGAFLTLGPTARQNSEPVLNPAFSSCDYSDHSSVLCQESLKSSSISHEPTFYSFLPIIDKDYEATSPEKMEAVKDVDLNLKL